MPFGHPAHFLLSSVPLRLQARSASWDDRRRQARFEQLAGLHLTISGLNLQSHLNPSLLNDDKPPGRLTGLIEDEQLSFSQWLLSLHGNDHAPHGRIRSAY